MTNCKTEHSFYTHDLNYVYLKHVLSPLTGLYTICHFIHVALKQSFKLLSEPYEDLTEIFKQFVLPLQ